MASSKEGRGRGNMRTIWVLLALLVAVGVGAGITYAAIPGEDGKVHLCFKTSDASKAGGAAVSVIDPAAGGSCKSGQTATSITEQNLVTGDASGPGCGGCLTPNSTGFTAEVTTSKPTKLFVVGELEMTVDCMAGTVCGKNAALHVDGEQQSSTVRFIPGDQGEQYRTVFAVVSVGAGEHTVEWQTSESGPNVDESRVATWVGVIALGG
jgi:hypothetical protein